MEKMRGRRPYKKCLGLVVKVYEAIVDDEDIQPIIEELDTLKKRLNIEEVTVVDRLCKSMNTRSIIEIDEASPGNDLNLKS